MKIAICDDNKKAINDIKEKIELQRYNDEIVTFDDSGDMTLEKMREFDLIYLDIKMAGINGMELTTLLRARQDDINISPFGSLPLIVFVTGYKEYMRQAFAVHAFDYLLKPVSYNTFCESYERAKAVIDKTYQRESVIVIKSAGETYTILLSNIQYIESQSRKNIIHLLDGDIVEYYGAMNDLEKELDNSFFRIHKGYIINMKYIKKYDRSSVTLSDGETLMMSKYRYSDFTTSYLSFIKAKEGIL